MKLRNLLILISLMVLIPFGFSVDAEETYLDPEKMYNEIMELKKEITTLKKESDVRKSLSQTKEEDEEEKEKVLNVAGREYTLMKASTFGFEYNFRYSYNSLDKLLYDVYGNQRYSADYKQDHTMNNSLFFEYALKDNLTVNTNLPFIYKYKNMEIESEQSLTELGDISLGVQWQPFKSGGKWPATIINSSITTPTGTSPYDITIGEELYSGNGGYAINIGASISKPVDPVYLYSSLSGVYFLPIDGLSQKWGSKNSYSILEKVEPGPGLAMSAGFAYSMSYKISLSFGYQLQYRKGTDYEFKGGRSTSSESYVSSSLSLGTSWRVNRKRSLHFKVNIGLTDNDSDFSISFRLPMQYSL